MKLKPIQYLIQLCELNEIVCMASLPLGRRAPKCEWSTYWGKIVSGLGLVLALGNMSNDTKIKLN